MHNDHINRLGEKKDGLRLDWDWYLPGKGPHQVCRARVSCDRAVGFGLGHFEVSVVEWPEALGEGKFGQVYEPQISYVGQILARDEERYPTRLSAQRKAEKLLTEFCEMMGSSLKAVGL